MSELLLPLRNMQKLPVEPTRLRDKNRRRQIHQILKHKHRQMNKRQDLPNRLPKLKKNVLMLLSRPIRLLGRLPLPLLPVKI